MKKLVLLTLCIFAIALASGCTSMNQSVPSASLTPYTPSAIVPDVKIGEKITGTATLKKVLFFNIEGDKEYADGVNYAVSGQSVGPINLEKMGLVSKAKAAAALKAAQQSGADFIVAPQYTVKALKFPLLYQEISVTVTGYKGTVTGFHQLKDEHLN